ncbi:MAG TPA: serine/threonine-protein kinase [Kofleriaceae bacterium]|nr:serine/threonine-protein kinase [Kofleriaceae bacterium]
MSDSRVIPARASTATMVGAVLGNYRITTEISTGGMGTVYRAQHELLGRSAAVKLLRPELTTNDELVERFFNEAKALSAIRHPGITEVYDFGYTEDGLAYLVMEFLDGTPLSRAISERGRFTEVEAATIARGIASALKAAHDKNIIHRDLKPDNVFLIPDSDAPTGERAKVLDFGIAKLADPGATTSRRTQTGVLMGTPQYMAPEQAREAGTIDARADLYSLGCILYELLVGQPPFVGEGAGEVIAMQMFNKPEPPSTRLVAVTPEMEEIVMRLLAKEPAGRYQTAGELAMALSAAGARLSSRLSAPLTAPLWAPSSPHHQQLGNAATQLSTLPMDAPPTFLDEPPPHVTASKQRSKLPIIAGAITLVVAAAAVVLVATHRESTPEPAPASTLEPAPVAPPSVPIASPDKPDKPDKAIKPDKPDKPDKLAQPDDHKPDKPADHKPDKLGDRKPDKRKPDKPDKAEHHKPDNQARHDGTKRQDASGPVTKPDGVSDQGAVTKPSRAPQGPTSPGGSPIETTLDDNKDSKKP